MFKPVDGEYREYTPPIEAVVKRELKFRSGYVLAAGSKVDVYSVCGVLCLVEAAEPRPGLVGDHGWETFEVFTHDLEFEKEADSGS